MIDGYGIQEDLRKKKKQKHAVGISYHRIGHISAFPKRWGGVVLLTCRYVILCIHHMYAKVI